MPTNPDRPIYKDAEAVAFCKTIKDIPLREAVARVIAWDNQHPMPFTWLIGNCYQPPAYQQFPKRSELIAELVRAGYAKYLAEHRVTRNYDTMTGGQNANTTRREQAKSPYDPAYQCQDEGGTITAQFIGGV